MKFALLLSMLFSVQMASAASFPELYCISTKSFENVTQINLFTNKKGTMKINLQHYAVSDDGSEAGNFDTNYLQTITGLDYSSSTGMIENTAGKLSLQVEKEAISPKAAQAILAKKDTFVDLENESGFRIDFKKYYKAKMITYTLKGRKGYWDSSLMEAFKGGVTDYICGNAKDMIGHHKTFIESLGNDND